MRSLHVRPARSKGMHTMNAQQRCGATKAGQPERRRERRDALPLMRDSRSHIRAVSVSQAAGISRSRPALTRAVSPRLRVTVHQPQ